MIYQHTKAYLKHSCASYFIIGGAGNSHQEFDPNHIRYDLPFIKLLNYFIAKLK